MTSRSDFARGPRAFKRNEALVRSIAETYAQRFGITIHIESLNGNHIHYFIRGQSLEGIRNFFRVFLGQVAQRLLAKYPIGTVDTDLEMLMLQPVRKGCLKNQRTFWEALVYSRIVSQGREFKRVYDYILRNILETLNVLAYKPRSRNQARKKPRYPT